MIENYQEQAEVESVEPQDATFATIGAVYDDGVTLVWDDTGQESEKHYKVNSFAVFHAGERVRVIKDCKTYVVEYSVGKPKKSFTADKAVEADTAAKATTASTAAKATTATNADTAANATKLNNKTESQLNVNSAVTATTWGGKHTASSIGFFSMSPTGRRSVSQATSDAQTRAQLNALIVVLKAYGLIS